MSVLDAALEYARKGWHVFPCKPNEKAPATPNGLKDATTDYSTIRNTFRDPDPLFQFNLAIRTGLESDLVVVDVDVDKGGLTTWDDLTYRNGIPSAPSVTTPSGGFHLYFAHPGGVVRNSAGKLGPGVDVRGDGGYVVAPPSTLPNGQYRWGGDGVAPPQLPGWLLELVQPKETFTTFSQDLQRELKKGPEATFRSESAGVTEGGRNHHLTSLAGSMRRRGMEETAIRAALLEENRLKCFPPLPESEVEQIAWSVARYAPERPVASFPITMSAEPRKFEVLSAASLFEEEVEEADNLVGPLVVRGHRLVVAGHTGQGKSSLIFQILKSGITGEWFLNWVGKGELRALYIDAEQSKKTIRKRLMERGLHHSDRLDVVRVPDGLELDQWADAAGLEEVLREGKYDIVAFDPLYKLHSGDSKDEREAIKLMKTLDKWREELGFALILATHCRKPFGDQKLTMHDIVGSSAYLRGAEVVIAIERRAEGASRLYFFKDRDGDLTVDSHWELLFDRKKGFEFFPRADSVPGMYE